MKLIILNILTIILIVFYLFNESFLTSDFACGCSSGCDIFLMSKISRLIGYVLILLSIIFFHLQFRHKIKTHPILNFIALIIIVVSTYFNGYYIYNSGACGDPSTLGFSRCFTVNKIGELGDDSYNLYKKDKILGFMIKNHDLSIYKVNSDKVIIKLKFLFWEIDEKKLEENLLDYLIPNISYQNDKIICIGGKDMTIEVFLYLLEKHKILNHNEILKYEISDLDNGMTKCIIKLKYRT